MKHRLNEHVSDDHKSENYFSLIFNSLDSQLARFVVSPDVYINK
jgi:hypothetical protein